MKFIMKPYIVSILQFSSLIDQRFIIVFIAFTVWFTSSIVLKLLKLNLTVPSGKVPYMSSSPLGVQPVAPDSSLGSISET